MRAKLSLKTLYRSPVRMILTFILLVAVTFTLFSQVLEHAVTVREINKAAEQYDGVGAVEVTPVRNALFGSLYTEVPYTILNDERVDRTNVPYDQYWEVRYENLTEEHIDAISDLPYITDVDMRYMTAGVSDEYLRLDDGEYFYNYTAQAILEGTLETAMPFYTSESDPDTNTYMLTFSDAKVVCGNFKLDLGDRPLYINTSHKDGMLAGSNTRCYFRTTTEYEYFPEFCQELPIGNRFAFVVRYEPLNKHMAGGVVGYPQTSFYLGDHLIETWNNTFWDITGAPENYIDTDEYAEIRQVADMIELNHHTFDVVYTDNIKSIMRFANGNMSIVDGRGIVQTDSTDNPNVCVISRQLAVEYGLNVGDTITMSLGDKLFTQYKGLGAVPVVPGREADIYTEAALEIVGIYTDIDAERQQAEEAYWSYSINTIFVPQALLNVSEEELANHKFYPGEVSFVVEDAGDIAEFSNVGIPKLKELGLKVIFEDQGWLDMEEGFKSTEKLGVIKILVLSAAVVVATWFVAMLYITGRRKDYAVMRVLGTSVRKTNRAMLLPFMLLSAVAVMVGAVGAWVNTQHTIAESNALVILAEFSVDTTIPFWVVVVSLVLAVLAAFAVAYLMLANLGKKAPLVLMQNSDTKRRKESPKKLSADEIASVHIKEEKITLLENLPKSKKLRRRFVWKYTFRHIKRASAKSLLTVLLCVLLLNVVGQLGIMIVSYETLVKETVVISNYVGGLPLSKIKDIHDSGYADEIYYVKSIRMDMNYTDYSFVVTNDISRYTGYEIEAEFADGYDESSLYSFGNTVIISKQLANKLGIKPGDTVVIGPEGYMKAVQDGHIERHREKYPEDTMSDGEILALYAEDIADIYGRESYECTVIAVFSINADGYNGADDNVVFAPGSDMYNADFGLLAILDIAEATVADNNLVDEYREFGQKLAGGSVTEGVMFVMDTSKLENLRNTLRLVEMLYPIAVVVTLVIGAFLCGLIIVQTSKDIAIMRVLGTSKAKTRTILVLEQMILCVFGIIIAGIILYIRGALSQMLWVFGAYALVILAASVVASVAASRKNVLELLQTKE